MDTWDGDASSPAFQRLHNDLVDYLGAPAASPAVTPEDVATKTPEPEPQNKEPEPGPEFLDERVMNPVGMEFVLISDGSFQMGSEDGPGNEVPVHTVRISQPFYLGVTPVTQAQWEAVMGNNPSEFKDDTNCPVEWVSWEDVQTFISKLKQQEPSARYRLPTEAEWEYAARAGTTTAYEFGDDSSQLGEYAWYNANSGLKTHPVGRLKANGWGLHDMYGNVWEWVWDRYGNYTATAADAPAVDPARPPADPAAGAHRVVRGGSWVDLARSCRSSTRGGRPPGYRSSRIGFRVLRLV
ncbi:MAG TPA: formylglycine-generating enzyme family protein [Candidatus Entotheonella sp.]